MGGGGGAGGYEETDETQFDLMPQNHTMFIQLVYIKPPDN